MKNISRAINGAIVLGGLGAFFGYAIRRLGWWYETDIYDDLESGITYVLVAGVTGLIIGFILGLSPNLKMLFKSDEEISAENDR